MLADSRNGYTCDFSIYEGKAQSPSGKGLSFDVVVELIKVPHLGTGYNIYVDNYYTSKLLFTHLHQLRFGACGPMREKRLGYPQIERNQLTKKAARGKCAGYCVRCAPCTSARLVMFPCASFQAGCASHCGTKQCLLIPNKYCVAEKPLALLQNLYKYGQGLVDSGNVILLYITTPLKTHLHYYFTIIFAQTIKECHVSNQRHLQSIKIERRWNLYYFIKYKISQQNSSKDNCI